MRKKSITLGIIHTSLGELQWIVPHFYEINRRDKDQKFVIIFLSKEVYTKAIQEHIHLSIFLEFGTIIQKSRLLSFLFSHRTEIGAIYKDFWPINRNSLAAAVRFCCPNATFYLYPHANAIYSLNQPKNSATAVVQGKHDTRCFDFLLLNTEYDVHYWRQRVPIAKISVIGSPAYRSSWLNGLARESEDELNIIRDKAIGKKIILVFTRPGDGDFLDPHDYENLIRSMVEVLSARKDIFVVFKLHPREDKTFLSMLLEDLGFGNFCISALSPISLCSIGYLSINFWSSTITDSIAAGCPSIEFFKYHSRGNDKWFIDSKGEYGSFYSQLGLCLKATDKNELEDQVDYLLHSRSEVLQLQQENLTNVFRLNAEELTNVPMKNSEEKIGSSIRDWLKVAGSSIKSVLN